MDTDHCLQKRIAEGTLPSVLLLEGCPETQAEELSYSLLSGKLTDFHPIKPEGNGHTMAKVRELIQEACLPPYEAACKVFLIYEADLLSENVQNALLKILEEPPKGTYFFLLCKSGASLLPTVLSRCTPFHFSIQQGREDTKALQLLRKILAERLNFGLSGWHDLLVEIDSLEEKDESALLEEILLWGRNHPFYPHVYEIVEEAHFALRHHVRFRHVFETLFLKLAVEEKF